MSRSARLLCLLQLMRRHRVPVSGAELAAELEISLRTLYRDIATLQGQGADIVGEAGIGYQLRPGFTLPPLMLNRDELEALTLGMAWVADRADTQMQIAARDVLAKIAAVIPEDLHQELSCTSMLVGPGSWATKDDDSYVLLRASIREEHKLILEYRDQHEISTQRTIWPCAIAVFDHVRVVVAWCELRGGFRHFRVDRIVALTATPLLYPRKRQHLMSEWRTGHEDTTDRN